MTEARSKNKKVNLIPDRTDMAENDIETILGKPVEEVIDMTVKELSDAGYSEELSELGFSGVADKINKDIKTNGDNDTKPKRQYRKKSNI